jgi:hypothetical protein
MRMNRVLGGSAVAAVLAGCAGPGGLASGPQGIFALAMLGATPAPQVAPAAPPEPVRALPPVVAPIKAVPEQPAATPAPSSGGGSGGGGVVYSYVPPVEQPTALSIALDGFLARFGFTPGHRRLLATSLLDHVTIVVSQDGRPDQTQTLPASNMHGGQTTAAFTGVGVGPVTITITAYDADGGVLGSAVQHAAVAAGQTNQVDTSVSLGHGDVQTVDTPLVDDGATGAAAPAPTGSEVGSFPGSGRLLPGPNGSIYFETVTFFQPQLGPHRAFFIGLRKVAADGTTSFTDGYNAGNLATVNDFVFTPGGILWEATSVASMVDATRKWTSLGFVASGVAATANGDGLFGAPKLIRVAPDGTKTTTAIPGGGTLAVDAQDHVWTVVKDPAPATTLVPGLSKFDLDGNPLATTPLAFVPRQLLVDPSGNVWALDTAEGRAALAAPAPGTTLAKIAPDGTLLGTFPVAGRQMACDAAGNLWISGPQLTKLAPDGTVLGTFPIDSAGVAVATDGMVWCSGSKVRRLYKLAP